MPFYSTENKDLALMRGPSLVLETIQKSNETHQNMKYEANKKSRNVAHLKTGPTLMQKTYLDSRVIYTIPL